MIIEDDNGMDMNIMIQENLEYYANSYLPYNIPFIWDISTSRRFPYYRHLLVSRNNNTTSDSDVISCSDLYPHYKKLVDSFCLKHNIQYKNVIRACINNTYHIPGEYQEAHVDFIRDHLVLIMYLNDVSGNTVIFDRKYSDSDEDTVFHLEDRAELNIMKEVSPKLGKILCFDGAYYHTIRSPKEGQHRSICIFNLLR